MNFKVTLLPLALSVLLSGCYFNTYTSEKISSNDVKNRDIGLWIGEARYLSSYCPNVQVNLDVGEKAANRAGYNVQALAQDGIKGMEDSRVSFHKQSPKRICQIALLRYGPKGNRIPYLLTRR